MPDWAYAAIAIGVIAALRPFFWTVCITALLWVGYRTLSNDYGKALFGRYWNEHHARRGLK